MPEAAFITTFSFCLKKSYFSLGRGTVLCKIFFLRAPSLMVEFPVLGRETSVGQGGPLGPTLLSLRIWPLLNQSEGLIRCPHFPWKGNGM